MKKTSLSLDVLLIFDWGAFEKRLFYSEKSARSSEKKALHKEKRYFFLKKRALLSEKKTFLQ